MNRALATFASALLLSFSSRAQLSDRDWTKIQLNYTEGMLTPSGDRPYNDSDQDTVSLVAGCVLDLRWVSRAELLARQRYLEKELSKHPPTWALNFSEQEDHLILFDNSVFDYRQDVTTPGPHGGGLDWPMWRRWVTPDKGYELFKHFVTDEPLSKDAVAEPHETDWCIIVTYVQGGKLRIKHFYVPNVTVAQTLVYQAHEAGTDSDDWSLHDERFQTPDWMFEKLKYNRELWYAKPDAN